MKKRWYYFTQSLTALISGLLCYLMLSENTYLHRIIKLPEDLTLVDISFFGDSFLRCYFPDFLWCYSLCMMLYTLWLPQKQTYVIAVASCSLGIFWEVMQLVSVAKGTFDIIDCVMYILAAFVSNIIYKRSGFYEKIFEHSS